MKATEMKTSTAEFKRRFTAIRRTARNGNADRALIELQKMLETWPDHPRLLVLEATLIQLSECEDGPTLAEAKRALKRAIEVDDDSPTPWIELGYYLLVIDDRVEKAEERFDHAIELALRHLIEAITGKIYAILDQNDPLPAEKLSVAADLIRLGQMLAERSGKSDSPEIRRLNERISEYHERTGGKINPGRNGRNGTRPGR
jgi:tetratricopeptide (TPR) repeat protein